MIYYYIKTKLKNNTHKFHKIKIPQNKQISDSLFIKFIDKDNLYVDYIYKRTTIIMHSGRDIYELILRPHDLDGSEITYVNAKIHM